MLAKIKQFVLRRAMNRLAIKHQPHSLPKEVKYIAVWQFGGVGDMLLATPVLEALHKQYPHANIHVWCSYPKFSLFLNQFSYVKSIHSLPIYDFDVRTLCKASVRRKLKNIMDAMKKQHPDILVNLHVPKLLDWWVVEWWILNKIKPNHTLGFMPQEIRYSLLDTYLSSDIVNQQHYTISYQQLLAKAGILAGTQTYFPIQEEEKARAEQLIKSIPSNKRVCLHMGGRRLAMENKMWSLANFIELGQKMISDGMIPILIGVENERDMGSKLCKHVSPVLNLIGETSMGEMAAIVATSRLFIGHDSGPFHIAAAMQTPSLAICGRPDAEPEYIAYHQENVMVLTADNPEDITVNDVYLASKKLLT